MSPPPPLRRLHLFRRVLWERPDHFLPSFPTSSHSPLHSFHHYQGAHRWPHGRAACTPESSTVAVQNMTDQPPPAPEVTPDSNCEVVIIAGPLHSVPNSLWLGNVRCPIMEQPRYAHSPTCFVPPHLKVLLYLLKTRCSLHTPHWEMTPQNKIKTVRLWYTLPRLCKPCSALSLEGYQVKDQLTPCSGLCWLCGVDARTLAGASMLGEAKHFPNFNNNFFTSRQVAKRLRVQRHSGVPRARQDLRALHADSLGACDGLSCCHPSIKEVPLPWWGQMGSNRQRQGWWGG